MENKSFIIKHTNTEHKVVTLQSTNVLKAEHNSDADDVSYVAGEHLLASSEIIEIDSVWAR